MVIALSNSMPPAQAALVSLLAEGLPNKLIAHRLGISQSAAEKRIQALRQRLDVPDKRSLERQCRAMLEREKQGIAVHYGFSELQPEYDSAQFVRRHEAPNDFWTLGDRAIIFATVASAISQIVVGIDTALRAFGF